MLLGDNHHEIRYDVYLWGRLFYVCQFFYDQTDIQCLVYCEGLWEITYHNFLRVGTLINFNFKNN